MKDAGDAMGVLMAISLGLLVIALLVFSGYLMGEGDMRREAVRHGAAEWIIIDEAGGTEFRWKDKEHTDD